MNGEDNNSVVTSVATPVDFIADGYIIMEADRLWSDLRWRVSTDDRRTNMSFKSTGYILVAIPTIEDPPDPPVEIEGLSVVSLEEYVYAVMSVMKANEKIRKTIIEEINNQF